jgi:hypothetical protein
LEQQKLLDLYRKSKSVKEKPPKDHPTTTTNPESKPESNTTTEVVEVAKFSKIHCMRYLKKTFLEQAGIYLYKCHKCRTFIDFSQKTCSKCNATNYYYDPTVQINQRESVRCYELLNRFKNSDDRFKETFLDDIMSGKIAAIPPQSKEVSGKEEETKEDSKVPKLEEKKNTAEQEEVKEVNVSFASNRESSQKEFMIKS